MTTPPDFSVGQVLTAAAMDAVGLWLVKTDTVGTGVSSHTVTGAFTADYVNYRVLYTGGTASGTGGIRFQLGGSTSTYYNTVNYSLWSGGGVTSVTNNNSVGYWQYAGAVDSNANAFMCIDVYEPNVARSTRFQGSWVQVDSGGTTAGIHRTNTAYTDFTITPDSGTLTGGTIYIYGYRP